MKSLAKWQFISLISRMTAMGLGIIQSFVIVRILTVGEYGLVQLAASIGGAFGIYQHLGLSSGSTREISSAKDDTEVFKIFATSIAIRYLVTIPIAIGLFFGASKIALGQYSESQLVLPLKIYAVVLLFQGAQGIMNSVIAGTKRFKTLFIYQAVIAVVSVLLYVPLVYLYKINGFFYALISFTVISTVTMGILAFKPLKSKLVLPTKDDFRRLLKELLSISLAIYVVKVLFTMWEKSGAILLGKEFSVEVIGVFSFALLFSKKIVHASDAVTDINLPVFSEKFVSNLDDFKNAFVFNFNKVFSFIIFAGVSAVFWSTELIQFVVGGNKYDKAFPFIFPLVLTFIFYSFSNIIKSSIFIPAKFVKEMILGYVLLIVGTISFYFTMFKGFGYYGLTSMTYGLLFGSFLTFLFLTLIAQYKLKFKFMTHDHVLLLIQITVIGLSSSIEPFYVKVLTYVLYTLLYVWALSVAKFVTKEEFSKILVKIRALVKK